jgi:hypothetical protein
VKQKLRSVVIGAALLAVLCGSAAAGGSNVPPKPEICKGTRNCILGCYVPAPMMPYGAMTSNTRLCNRLGLPLVWFVRAR